MKKGAYTSRAHCIAPHYTAVPLPYPGGAFGRSPPPPYPCSSTGSPLSGSDYSLSPPPLPPRERILIGRHAARFDLKLPPEGRMHGDKVDTIYAGGRIKKKFINPIVLSRRRCTDVICCFLFVLFVIGWVAVAVFGFMWGKPDRLIHPTDSLGRTCGVQRDGYYDLRSKPYLFFFDLTKCFSYSIVFAGCQTPQICVSKCPTQTFSYLQMRTTSTADFQKEVNEKIICKENVGSITDFTTLKQRVDSGDCASYTVPSAAVLQRCMPELLLNLGQTFDEAQSANSTLNQVLSSLGNSKEQLANSSYLVEAYVAQKSVVEKIAADLSVTWWQILAFLLATAVIAFLWTLVMRILGSFLIWCTILIVVVALAGGSGYCWYRYKMLFDAGAVTDYSFQPNVGLYFEMPTTWLIIGIVLSVVLIIVLLILLYVRTRIRLAVALIQESSKAIGSMTSSLLFPIFPFALHLLVFVLWGCIAIWLATSGNENCRRPLTANGDPSNGTPCDCSLLGTGQDPTCQYVNLTREDGRILGMQVYNLFAFFWVSCFVSALADITLAGAFASFFWAFNKPKDVPSFPVIRSLGRACRYHLGTVAFGSLILALVKFIRAILDYLEKKLSAAQNEVAKFILMCLKCCFWCLEAFLKFLTKNAYIMTAIYGKNFCTAARDSFMLIMKNIVRFTVLDKVTDFLLFLGKATITLGMGVVAFYWFSGRWIIDGLPHIDLYYYFVPIAVVVIGAYFIADSFFNVYEVAVDTTFLCFLEDAESNDGTPDKPYYMSKELQRILGKENQFKTYQN